MQKRIDSSFLQPQFLFSFSIVINCFDLNPLHFQICRVSGVPILWGWDKLSIEGLVWYPKEKGNGKQPDKAVAVGMVIEGIRLDQLMEKIFGENLFKTAWFSEMVAGMCIEVRTTFLGIQTKQNMKTCKNILDFIQTDLLFVLFMIIRKSNTNFSKNSVQTHTMRH